jgi:murein DD-endopeptidase MepM/ murein hydrolase activator NlpD
MSGSLLTSRNSQGISILNGMRTLPAFAKLCQRHPMAITGMVGGTTALAGSLAVALTVGVAPATATLPLPSDVTAATSAPLPPLEVQRTITLNKGSTLKGTLSQLGFSPDQIQAMTASSPAAAKPVAAKTELTLSYKENTPYHIADAHISYRPTPVQQLSLVLKGNYVRAMAEDKPTVNNMAGVVGTIRNSLYEDGRKAGMSPQQITAFMNLFAWDLDYTRDIHPGDSFKVMFEQTVSDQGVRLKTGKILAASFTVAGETRYAYWYGDANSSTGAGEYLNEKGESKRKLLLRTPIEFTRISSNFGLRFHPVLGFSRMHKGTDFAAPQGTPIKASGDGTITWRAPHGGHGNYIKIQHNSTFTTGYGHMSRFAPGFAVGSRVKQGQIIGYVGSTGISTGPHLHYEVIKNGDFVDAMRTDLPTSSPLSAAQLAQFKARVAQAQLAWANGTAPLTMPTKAKGIAKAKDKLAIRHSSRKAS